MPQMAPMSWLLLMFYFSLIFIMMNTLNYFSFNYETMLNKSKKINKMNYNTWKW